LLVTFLTGFGIATGVSLFVIPLTSRAIVNKELGGMIKLMRAFVEYHVACMSGVSTHYQDNLWDVDQRVTQKIKMGGAQLSISNLPFRKAELTVDLTKECPHLLDEPFHCFHLSRETIN